MDSGSSDNAVPPENPTAGRDDSRLSVIKMCMENAIKLRWMQDYVERSKDEIQRIRDELKPAENNLETQLQLQIELNNKEEERCEILEEHILSIKDIIEMLKKR